MNNLRTRHHLGMPNHNRVPMLPVNGFQRERTMCGKWRYGVGALVLALAVAVMPLQAQRGQGLPAQGFRGQGGPNMGHSIELALENQDELGLTEDQAAQLQELKTVIDGDVARLGQEMKVLRESIRAGEVDREEGMRQMEALRGEVITASAPLRGRVQEILTVEQHNKLSAVVRQDRPGGGRVPASQGRGASSVRGRAMGPGMPGQLRGGRGGLGRGLGIGGRGQARVPGLRQGVGVPRAGRGMGPAPFIRRGLGGQSPEELGNAGNLP